MIAPTPIRDPAEIYRRSFAIIQAEADLARFGADTRSIVVRMIHACGMVDLADDIVVSPGFAKSARTALDAGAPVLCDAEMVRHGIITRLMPAGNAVKCLLNEPEVREIAARDETTRSAAQVDLWAERMAGAVIAIGNAPWPIGVTSVGIHERKVRTPPHTPSLLPPRSLPAWAWLAQFWLANCHRSDCA